MAGTAIAYSEITILDLIDTATYIYYSENESGSGATTAPTATTKYIGIYSGPPFEDGQPNTPPTGTEWTKYVGEDGAPGEGVTVSSVDYDYAISKDGQNPPTTGWQLTVPSLSGGDYLWSRTSTTYSDGKTTIAYSVSYSGIDGTDANTYYIETNQEEILLFKEYREDDEGNKIEVSTFSPSTLSFRIYENPKQTDSEQIELTESNFSLEIQNEDSFELVEGSFLTLGQIEENGRVLEENTVFFDIGQYYNSLTEENQKKLISSNFQIFRFSYLINNKIAAIKIFQLRKGVSEDMATFNLHAAGFNAAIQNTKLDFSAEGLKVFNGGIKIIDNNQQDVFYADSLGNLVLKGTVYSTNGEFTGKVIATEGEFNGAIKASSGTIGGFTINEENLISADGTIELNGKTGYITAETINLGTGAKIAEYIELPTYNENGEIISTAKIYNPNNNNGKFIETEGILLTSNGILNIGDIILDGVNSKISGINFSITPNLAQFSNIDCSGVIRTAVFEKNKVQSVGGSMIFRPSYKIKESNINEATMVLDETFDGESGDIVLLVAEDGSSSNYIISQVNGSNIILTEAISREYTSLVYIGKSSDIIIGINSNEGLILNGKVYGEGLTITSWGNSDKPNLFLGNLANLQDSTLTGFGLYADNVYLRGSLTTQIPISAENPTYAGINTIHEIKKNGENIVFWAGAESYDKVPEAPFIVTENGTIYATSGIFKGSIITDSTISGAHLYTTHLHGGTEGTPGGLYIHDANIGINFVQNYESDADGKQGTTILQIKSDGFRLLETDAEGFIYINREDVQNPYVNFNGKNISVEKAEVGFLTLEQNSITSSNIEGNENPLISFISQNGFYFKKDLEDNLFFVTSSETHNTTGHLLTEGNFTVQSNEHKLAYQLNNKGYDLYIS